MSELAASDRWWVVSDEELVETLLRVEAGELSAAEAYALMFEHAVVERP